jgi:urease accessory protein
VHIAVESRGGRARVDLRAGLLVPRLVGAGEDSASVAVIAGRALLLDGDHVEAHVRVGAGCLLEIEDIGGTVAYGSTGTPSSWTVDIEVAEGGCLIWHALPFVVADAADVTRTTTIRLGRGATALVRETLVLGRTGERGGRLRACTHVTAEEGPLLREELVLDGAAPRIGVLGDARVLDGALSVGRRREAASGALQLDGPGTIVRALGAHTHAATVEQAWRAWVVDELGRPRTSAPGSSAADGAEPGAAADVGGARRDGLV